MGLTLTQKFRQNIKIYKQKRHGNTTNWEKTKVKRIEKFLRSCETQRVKDIKQAKQKNFDTFMQEISKTKSQETVRQYALAISEFATRAHLPIRICANKAKNRKVRKKADKIIFLIEQKLNIKIPDDLTKEISKIL